ncbi:hypothetical protein [Salibacterium aidingense]
MDEARRWFSSFIHFPLIISAFDMEMPVSSISPYLSAVTRQKSALLT